MIDTYNSAAEAEADRARQKASRSTRVELEPIGLTEQGQRYRVTYAGETLVEGRHNPIFDRRVQPPAAAKEIQVSDPL